MRLSGIPCQVRRADVQCPSGPWTELRRRWIRAAAGGNLLAGHRYLPFLLEQRGAPLLVRAENLILGAAHLRSEQIGRHQPQFPSERMRGGPAGGVSLDTVRSFTHPHAGTVPKHSPIFVAPPMNVAHYSVCNNRRRDKDAAQKRSHGIVDGSRGSPG